MKNVRKNEQEYLVQKIRTQYTEKQHTELDELKALDRKVKMPAMVFSYIFGSVSALVMGAGMSLVMTDIGETIGMADPMIPGMAVGVTGMGVLALAYPVYNRTLKQERAKAAPGILRLTEELMK